MMLDDNGVQRKGSLDGVSYKTARSRQFLIPLEANFLWKQRFQAFIRD
jgi:hypothetical protein